MIADAIDRYLTDNGTSVTEKALSLLADGARASAARNFGELEERRARDFGGSLSWYCMRRAHYSLIGRGDRPRGRARMAFFMGDVIEQAVVLLARQAGAPMHYPTEDGEQYRCDFEVSGVRCHGEADIVTEGWGIVDVKSMSPYGFNSFEVAARRGGNGAWFQDEAWGYIAQVRYYMLAAEIASGERVQKGCILGVCKATGRMADLWFDRCEDTIAFFERAIPYLDQCRRSGTVPARAHWAKGYETKSKVMLPDGSRGHAYEVATNKQRSKENGMGKATVRHGWRCGYCPNVAECFGVEAVPQAGGVMWRRPV